MERSRAVLTSVCSDTQRQQPSAHAHADNEDWALAVETRREKRKDDMDGEGEQKHKAGRIVLSPYSGKGEVCRESVCPIRWTQLELTGKN